MLDKVLTPDFFISLVAFAVFAGLALYMRRQHSKPRDTLKPPLVPYTPVMLVCTFLALMSIIHLLTVLGLHKVAR
jgi:hypothetical protein